MSDPQDILRQLAAVRRAWRRTAVFAGCAVAGVEAAGVLALFLLVDLLFVGSAGAHTILATLTWTTVAALFVWHGGRPFLRRISDGEIALFIEERNPAFQGALLTAIEYTGSNLPPAQAELVGLAVSQAIAEAGAHNPVTAVRLINLRKYVIAIACLLLSWAVALLATPASVKRRVLAAFNPLHDPTIPLDADGRPLDPALTAVLAGMKKAEEAPKELLIDLDPAADSYRIRRGDALPLEVICSRRPDQLPRVLVRSAADANAAWRAINLAPVERVNGFGGQIADISEELVFYVASGEVRTPERKITVYDPLALAGIEAVITPPGYLGGTPATIPAPDGDVKIPDGGKVSLRFIANRALAKGELRWEDGTTVSGTTDQDGVLVLAFDAPAAPVTATTFTWTVRDADGETVASSRPARILVEGDRAPTLDLEIPTQPVAVTPRGEVRMRVKAWDDHGLVGNELRWTRYNATGAIVAQGVAPLSRLPAPVAKDPTKPKANDPPGTVFLTATLALEALVPPPNPQDIFVWNIAVTDGKQQVATTSLGVISILDYEVWQTWEFQPATGQRPLGPPGVLADVLDATWDILRDRQAQRLKPDGVPARSQTIAKQMEAPIDPAAPAAGGVQLLSYMPFPIAETPAQRELVRKVTPLVKTAHAALLGGDPQAAKEVLETGVALISVYMLSQNSTLIEGELMAGGGGSQAPNQAKIALEQARLDAQKAIAEEQARREAELKLATAASQALQQLVAIKRDHDQVQERVLAMDARAVDEVRLLAPAVGERERKLAERVRAVADDMSANPVFRGTPLADLPKGINLSETAMRAAVAALGRSELKDAAHQTKIADQHLNEVLLAMKQFTLDSLSESLEATEQQLAEVLAKQRELIDRTRLLAAATTEPTLAQQRETTAVAATQARLKGENDTMQLAAEGLPKVVESWAASDVLRQVELALKALRSGQPGRKMVNGVIELQAAHPAKALAQERLAEASLSTALTALREALASVALDRAQLMNQITKEVKLARADLAQVQPEPKPEEKPPEPKPPEPKPPEEKPEDKSKPKPKPPEEKPEGKPEPKPPEPKPPEVKPEGKPKPPEPKPPEVKPEGKPKPPEPKPPEVKPEGKPKPPEPKPPEVKPEGKPKPPEPKPPEDKPEDKPKPKPKPPEEKPEGKPPEPKPPEPKPDGKIANAAAHRAAERMQNLAKMLEKAGLNAKDLKDMAADPKELAKRLAADPSAKETAVRIVDRVARMVEKEVASTADSGKLLSGGRGECPPQYRQLVNRYFETMSRFGDNGRAAP